ncbi:transposase [Hyphomonas sp.]|uniref:transposase n=1 Tax=Hyphomonas sp. TaxID=87 RepID=UPI0034A0A7DB
MPRWRTVSSRALRQTALAGTQFANASCGTIRLKLLKVGARVLVSVRRIRFGEASAYPWAEERSRAHRRLTGA